VVRAVASTIVFKEGDVLKRIEHYVACRRKENRVQLLCGFIWFDFITSSLFPYIPLGFSSGLEAFGAAPETPHLEVFTSLILGYFRAYKYSK